MTVPSPSAGWYPDPDGAPGTARWWNGVSWSDVTTPAGPGVAVGAMPSAPAPAAPPGEVLSGDGAEPGGRRTAWVLGGGVLALVLLVVAAVLVGRSGDAAPSAAAPPPPAEPSGSSASPPGTVRIVD